MSAARPNGHTSDPANDPAAGVNMDPRTEHVKPPAQRPDADALEREWATDPRWAGVRRDYTADDVLRLRGSIRIERTLAWRGARRLWDLLETKPYVPALGALTGSQAIQMVRAGVPAIYVSGWQVAADNNLSNETYPDLGLYAANSVPRLVERINNSLLRADRIEQLDNRDAPPRDWLAPIIADAEAGFGGPLNAYELTRHLVVSGAAAVHLEDQLSTARKCGHMGGKVLVPASQHIRNLRAARLAADVEGVPTVLIARTDAKSAKLLASDIDEDDAQFLEGKRTHEGFFESKGGMGAAIARGLAYAPYCDLIWYETNKPNIDEARAFAAAIHAKYPGKKLAYNLSSSFHWTQHLDTQDVADFMPELGKAGYRFQFVTLAGWHAMNAAIFELAHAFAREGMPAYVKLQEREFALQQFGYTAVQHQHEVGAGYFDAVGQTISPGDSSAQALEGSTEKEQFQPIAEKTTPVMLPNGITPTSGRRRRRPKREEARQEN
jgi:isocitrate lyase